MNGDENERQQQQQQSTKQSRRPRRRRKPLPRSNPQEEQQERQRQRQGDPSSSSDGGSGNKRSSSASTATTSSRSTASNKGAQSGHQRRHNHCTNSCNGESSAASNRHKNTSRQTQPSLVEERNGKNSRKQQQKQRHVPFPSHWTLQDCLTLYHAANHHHHSDHPPAISIIRGKIRVLPGNNCSRAFVTCDRGRLQKDVLIDTPLEQNRALDGDTVFVELLYHHPNNKRDDDDKIKAVTNKMDSVTLQQSQQQQQQVPTKNKPLSDHAGTWREDDIQRRLWNPQVDIYKPQTSSRSSLASSTSTRQDNGDVVQLKGRVVHVCIPNETAGTQPSELKPADESHLNRAPKRTIVGRLHRMPAHGRNSKNGGARRNNVVFLQPNNRSLPQFVCPSDASDYLFRNDGGPPSSAAAASRERQEEEEEEQDDASALYRAEYVYGSWKESYAKPPCINVQKMGTACNVQDETLALLLEFDVNHGDFSAPVLKNVDEAVESGMELLPVSLSSAKSNTQQQAMGWRPTREMYRGRRDFTKERIFTIDPTTAKDLDDALHVKALPDGRVEIGVHIADVSYFVQPDTAVDAEAARRATTVYLVDRTVPMLPRPLCEIACSLNENVERLAFSCVWRMNMDGSVESQDKSHSDDVWYGRSVIKSCARLDYATAQNIIEEKVATGEPAASMDESLWPMSRRPIGKHTVDQVAADVRLMNRVAQARRRLRFQNGALALNGIKLAFQLDQDGETPTLCAPYPLRDSNRLVEEYMLLANYFVAQRLITHAGGLALLRHHPPPLMDGVDQVVQVAKEAIGFEIDPTSSHALQASLSRLGRECDDDLVIQCVTEMLMTPMKPAEYMAAGTMESELWRHFALNIPFYTHFTSPIRRYADVIVHRLLQATLDGEDAIDSFPMDASDIQAVSSHCNDKKMASKKAQDRSDRVFLALYLRRRPLKRQLGVVLSVGVKTFTVFVPSLGASVLLFLDEHKDVLTFEPYSTGTSGERRIRLVRKTSTTGAAANVNANWSSLDIKVFTKVSVSCHCNEKPPIDVKLKFEGPWSP